MFDCGRSWETDNRYESLSAVHYLFLYHHHLEAMDPRSQLGISRYVRDHSIDVCLYQCRWCTRGADVESLFFLYKTVARLVQKNCEIDGTSLLASR